MAFEPIYAPSEDDPTADSMFVGTGKINRNLEKTFEIDPISGATVSPLILGQNADANSQEIQGLPDPTDNSSAVTRGFVTFNNDDRICNLDYMAHWYNELQALSSPQVNLCGDSTLAGQGITNPAWLPGTIVQRCADQNYTPGATVINSSVGASTTTQWVNTYMPAVLATNPDCVVLGTGINDTALNDDQFRAVYGQLLQLCRDHGDVDSLTIIVMVPNSTDTGAIATPEWHKRRNYIYRDLAHQYQATLIDRFGIGKNAEESANIWMDSDKLHPLNNFNASLLQPLCDVLFPRLIREALGGYIFVDPNGAVTVFGNIQIRGSVGGTVYHPRDLTGTSFSIYNPTGDNLRISAGVTDIFEASTVGEVTLSGSGNAMSISPRTGSGIYKLYNSDGTSLIVYDAAGVKNLCYFYGNGDIECATVGAGFVLKSPNGTRWRLTVSNAGVVGATAI